MYLTEGKKWAERKWELDAGWKNWTGSGFFVLKFTFVTLVFSIS